VANSKDPSIVIAHRFEIVSQISLTLARYGIMHNLVAPNSSVREIIKLHIVELGRHYYDPNSLCAVAGVDTLLRMDTTTHWFKRIKLVVQDEGHHVLKTNKWGTAAALFPNARGLYPTATPVRADGKGLGRQADGIIDRLIVGPPMRDLIKAGYLTDYRIIAPPNDLDLSAVPISASGDYSPPKLRNAVHKSHITGDVVTHYLKFAKDKLGVTFAVDIESATEIAAAYRENGVPAEVISSKTPSLLRSSIMRRFRNREILQLVNVDLLGEGVDVPAIEVVSFARPTQSYCLYAQQFGRSLRPMSGKKHAIIIDHVSNVLRHGLVDDLRRRWSLDRRDRRGRNTPLDVTPVKTCLNPQCLAVYERTERSCPACGFYTAPSQRGSPEFVDGDLNELDPETLAKLRGEIGRIDSAPKISKYLEPIAQAGIAKQHARRQEEQRELRSAIAAWAGWLKHKNLEDSKIYKTFYFAFGIDIATAQTLGAKEAQELTEKIKMAIDGFVNL
jgi:superfamily II DNA or RNA helicase